MLDMKLNLGIDIQQEVFIHQIICAICFETPSVCDNVCILNVYSITTNDTIPFNVC